MHHPVRPAACGHYVIIFFFREGGLKFVFILGNKIDRSCLVNGICVWIWVCVDMNVDVDVDVDVCACARGSAVAQAHVRVCACMQGGLAADRLTIY